MSRHRQGLLLCLVSAAGFGAMAIFAKLAYRHGGDVTTVLVLRFLLAAAVTWAVVRVVRAPLPDRRTALGAAALGVLYAGQAGCYFAALQHISASLNALLLYTYPAMVFAAALALGRERAGAVKTLALGLSAAGTVLVLVAGGTGALNAPGVLLGLGAAVIYCAYILVADRVLPGAHPLPVAALVLTTAFLAFLVVSPLIGGVHPGRIDGDGWLAMAGVALVSTVLAASLFLAGLARVGPSTASIVSTVEPAVTVGLAALVFGERLDGMQLVGGALVLAAVVALQLRLGGSKVGAGVAADLAAAAPAARPAQAHAS
ncbi:MAG TPA: DMT family transporter [Solirubrobacteraceae bacterium]|nr:DMT family transporter [Solirubrobacteraceae bacterium]